MKKIKTAIIGLGRISHLLEKDSKREKPCTHLGTYLFFPDCFDVIAGCDINFSQKESFLTKIPNARFYDKIQELLEKEKPELLSIATHAETHLDIFKLIKSSKYIPKMIWLEKPIEINLKKSIKLKRIKDSLGITVLVNHERRYDAHYRLVKSIIDSGELGVLKTIYAVMWRKASDKIAQGSGTLLEDGTHLLDILLYWLNQYPSKIISTKELLKTKKVEKRVYGTLYFRDIPVFFESGGDREYFHFELDLSFTKGRIRIGNGIFEVYEKKESPYYENFFSLMPKSIESNKTNMFLVLGQEIIDFFTKNQPISSTLEDSIKVMKLIDSIYS